MPNILRAPDGTYFSKVTSQWRGRNKSRPTHQGVDMGVGAPAGTKVLAIGNGAITHVSPGLVIQSLNEFPGFFARYVHVKNPDVAKGDQVLAGDDVADMGDVNTSIPHLHFETRTLLAGKSVDVDPNPLLQGKAPVAISPPLQRGAGWLLLLTFLILSELK